MIKTIEMEQKFLSEMYSKNTVILELTAKVESLEEQVSKAITERDEFAAKLADSYLKAPEVKAKK